MLTLKIFDDYKDLKIFDDDDDLFSDELVDLNHPINSRSEGTTVQYNPVEHLQYLTFFMYQSPLRINRSLMLVHM